MSHDCSVCTCRMEIELSILSVEIVNPSDTCLKLRLRASMFLRMTASLSWNLQSLPENELSGT